MDFAFLLQDGIRHLERMAGPLWTDFNAHDPGLTILEQLCYALSDLGYRIGHEMPDLLASGGGDPYESLYPPSEILTSHPVTLLDLLKLVLDVNGVKNAWIEQADEDQIALYYHPGRKELGLQDEPPASEPVKLKGLYRVLIETSELADTDRVTMRANVARRLHQNRNLCEDLAEIRVLQPQSVQVQARVEIGPVEDAEQVLLEIIEKIADVISPSVPFVSLERLLAAGKSVDEIFDGPRLKKGFPLEGSGRARRSAVNTSDLIHVIMEVPGVRAVSKISVSTGGQKEAWSLKLEPDKAPKLDLPKLDLQGSKIQLEKEGITAGVDVKAVIDTYNRRRKRSSAAEAPPGEGTLTLPPGRDRNVDHYRSIQHDFPALYGIGEMGLPESAPPLRRARARQLEAYLAFFDQILADSFAQLAHVKDLFSHHGQDPRTYFTQKLANLAGILEDDGDDSATAATREAALTDASYERKNRFLGHLLARFAEQLTATGTDPERKLRAKQAFLQSYPRISSARGTAFDQQRPWDASNLSGLEERLRFKLGLDEKNPGEELVLVEHILLRPMEEDAGQSVVYLAAAAYRDPYSLQLSVVLQEPDGSGFKQFVEQTIREETPAHLVPYVHWLASKDWSAFLTAHRQWHSARTMSTAPHFHLRDTRDRLIDLLGLGETYPLQDVAVSERLTVPFEVSAKISIDPGQPAVEYELHDRDEEPVPSVFAQTGTGDEILLETPPIVEDVTYKILARKPGREAYLHQETTIKVGLDVRLDARILAPLLRPLTDKDTWMVGHGGQVDVEIVESQEGVDYHLVHLGDAGQGPEEVLSQVVRGNRHDIKVRTDSIWEPKVIRIRATREFEASEGREPQTDLLDAVLPIDVRGLGELTLEVDFAVAHDLEPIAEGILPLASSLSADIAAQPEIRLEESEVDYNSVARILVVASWKGEKYQPFLGGKPVKRARYGNGGDLVFLTEALLEDTTFEVHVTRPDRIDVERVVRLDVAVRPPP